MTEDELKNIDRRIEALSPEKRALYLQIITNAEIVCASDLLGLTNYRAGWAEYVASELRKRRK